MSIINGIEDDVISDGIFDVRVRVVVSFSEQSVFSKCVFGILWRIRRTGTEDWSASLRQEAISEVVKQSGIEKMLPMPVNDASAHQLTAKLINVLKDWAGQRRLGGLKP
jgi:hypothetical protein